MKETSQAILAGILFLMLLKEALRFQSPVIKEQTLTHNLLSSHQQLDINKI